MRAPQIAAGAAPRRGPALDLVELYSKVGQLGNLSEFCSFCNELAASSSGALYRTVSSLRSGWVRHLSDTSKPKSRAGRMRTDQRRRKLPRGPSRQGGQLCG